MASDFDNIKTQMNSMYPLLQPNASKDDKLISQSLKRTLLFKWEEGKVPFIVDPLVLIGNHQRQHTVLPLPHILSYLQQILIPQLILFLPPFFKWTLVSAHLLPINRNYSRSQLLLVYLVHNAWHEATSAVHIVPRRITIQDIMNI